ncbi:MAG: class I SAM-dependent methyltransferase [Pseudomonadales bacterium]|jgi:predicted methyltransferase
MKKFLMCWLCVCLLSPLASADVAVALANSERPEVDRNLDPYRKPGEVLTFFGIEPGMAVFDVFAGSGYYTEILSNLVGPGGRVVHYNNAPWAAFVKTSVEKRFADGRLANVERRVAPPESLKGHGAEFDAAMFVLGMHDIYYADPDTGWVAIDVGDFTQGLFDMLKPGGVLGVIDHNGEPGSDAAEIGKSLHRVDPARIIADLTAVGFVLEAESYVLANPQDDKSTNVFIEENRMRTDRSVLKFRKPR